MYGSLPLPPPPDAYQQPRYDFNEDEKFINQLSGGIMSMRLDSGMHIFSSPNLTGSMTLFARVRDYPEVRELETLITSIRYICSRNEYRKINDSNYPKKELDNFWIETAGSKDKAKDLISEYYNRVRESNIYFSSVTEGWRTDRGLVHVVFGNPNKVLKEGSAEVWIYGEENNLNSLTFRFVKKDHPHTHNLYVLERNPMYKPGWDRAVSAWRNGRIFAQR
ncbi:MAG: GWxTD domain-containing protein [Bacteroidota bacterium]